MAPAALAKPGQACRVQSCFLSGPGRWGNLNAVDVQCQLAARVIPRLLGPRTLGATSQQRTCSPIDDSLTFGPPVFGFYTKRARNIFASCSLWPSSRWAAILNIQNCFDSNMKFRVAYDVFNNELSMNSTFRNKGSCRSDIPN